MAFASLFHRSARALRRGFTLVELLVVCAIIIVVSSLIIIDNNKFGGEITLENLAYDVALSIRQAQVYGIAVQRFGSAGTATFALSYGVHFDSTLDSDNPAEYILFADEQGTGVYNSAYTPSEAIAPPSPYVLAKHYEITDLCAVPAGCGLSSLDIVFKQPEPDAIISVGTNGNPPVSCITNSSACQQQAEIVFTSPKGDTATTTVTDAGQIYVPVP